jgi:hypothetical protein
MPSWADVHETPTDINPVGHGPNIDDVPAGARSRLDDTGSHMFCVVS